MAEGDADQALRGVLLMLEATPDSSKPSDFAVSLPAYDITEQLEQLAVLLLLHGQNQRPSAPNFLMKR